MAREAKAAGEAEKAKKYLRRAYFDGKDLSESFWQFSKHISGRVKDGLTEDRRREFADFVADEYRFLMLQAARGSWKSSLAVVDYIAWIIGRDMVLNNDESRVRILLASETESLAKRNLRGVRNILETRRRYTALLGKQRPPGRTSKSWGRTELTCVARRDHRILEPTISVMGQDTEATGTHYDLIICDDLQAVSSSSTADQLENAWEFYRLLLSILDRQGKIIFVCTRWHPEDIYQRIEDQNNVLAPDKRFKILKIPSDDGDTKQIGKLNFPNVLPKTELEALREQQGVRIFNMQYRLRVSDDDDATFKQEWLQFVYPELLKQRQLNVYTTADFAWTEKSKMSHRQSKKPDFTVVETWAVDNKFRYICLDWFRERCSKREAVKEVYRQYFTHMAMVAIMQRYDRSQIADTIDQYGYEYGAMIAPEWIYYPPRMGKRDRIESALAPLFEAGKVYLMSDMDWFVKEEYLVYPKGKFDGFECIANVHKIAAAAAEFKQRQQLTPTQKRIKQLKAGTFDPNPDADEWMRI